MFMNDINDAQSYTLSLKTNILNKSDPTLL